MAKPLQAQIHWIVLFSIASFAAVFMVDPGGRLVNYGLLAIVNLVLIGTAEQID